MPTPNEGLSQAVWLSVTYAVSIAQGARAPRDNEASNPPYISLPLEVHNYCWANLDVPRFRGYPAHEVMDTFWSLVEEHPAVTSCPSCETPFIADSSEHCPECSEAMGDNDYYIDDDDDEIDAEEDVQYVQPIPVLDPAVSSSGEQPAMPTKPWLKKPKVDRGFITKKHDAARRALVFPPHPRDPDITLSTRNSFTGLEGIRNYTFNPLSILTPKWGDEEQEPDMKKTPLFGVELECHARINQPSSLPKAIERASNGFLIVKHDASIGPLGMELCTTPATRLGQIKFWNILLDAVGNRIKADYTSVCGLHVHISKSALSPLDIGKMLVLWNDPNNLQNIVDIGGRVETNYWRQEGWHEFIDAIEDPRLARSEGRGVAVNMNKGPTIELRLFQATTNRNKLLGRIEAAAASVDFVKRTGIRNISIDKFIDWIAKNQDKYEYLAKYLHFLGKITVSNPLNTEAFSELEQIRSMEAL